MTIPPIISTPVSLTDQDMIQLKKLMLNSWSAEYALNIKPILTDVDHLKAAISWTFPQAYYTALFSARAVLLASGLHLYDEKEILGAMKFLASFGLYCDYDSQSDISLFTDLQQYRLPDILAVEWAKDLLYDKYVELCKMAETINGFHEAYIREMIGTEAYLEVVNSIPEYMGFVAARAKMYDIITEEIIA